MISELLILMCSANKLFFLETMLQSVGSQLQQLLQRKLFNRLRKNVLSKPLTQEKGRENFMVTLWFCWNYGSLWQEAWQKNLWFVEMPSSNLFARYYSSIRHLWYSGTDSCLKQYLLRYYMQNGFGHLPVWI